MKVQQSHSQHPPATTEPPTTARRLSYPGRRLNRGLAGRPGGPADRQTDRQKRRRNLAQSGFPWQDIASTK